MQNLAHITKINNCRIEQSLKEHCVNTAAYAKDSLGSTAFKESAYLAGILHDMGKAKKEFQTYLEKGYNGEDTVRGSVNHTFAAVIYLLETYHNGDNSSKLASETLAYAVGAHHGLFDCCDLEGANGFVKRLEKDKNDIGYDEALNNYFLEVQKETELKEEFREAADEIWGFFEKQKNRYKGNGGADAVFFQCSMMIRLLLSSVIYGDRRDTMEFMYQQKQWKNTTADWEEELAHLESNLNKFKADTPINKARASISSQCKEKASDRPDIYRLSVPTGGGKTLSALRYALAHAEIYNKKRIIFVIPLLSILDQNARVIRDNLSNPEILLEHHSNVVHEKNLRDELDPYEMLKTTWDSPIIVTTMVRLLEVLFGGNTSDIGRMQALTDSVIVIDEVQSLPKKTMNMFNMALNFLKNECNATIVLSSATQPCMEKSEWPIEYNVNAPEMVTLSEEEKQSFKRAEIINAVDPYGFDNETIASKCCDIIENQSSLLLICNTKKEAYELYEILRERLSESVLLYHLSTSMCKKHRMVVLKDIIDNLEKIQSARRKNVATKKLICISTQLVEAGVDFSFECVIRIMAGIDNLSQAAGRCNRSNEYGRPGSVYLIRLKNENIEKLPDIKIAKDSTQAVINDENAVADGLISNKAIAKFYNAMFSEYKNSGNTFFYPVKINSENFLLASLLANKNGYITTSQKKWGFIFRQPFSTIGRNFSVFENNTFDVLVPYKDGSSLIERFNEISDRIYEYSELSNIISLLKDYTVSIFAWQRDKLEEAGFLYSMLDDRIMVLKPEAYDERLGLFIPNYEVESFIL